MKEMFRQCEQVETHRFGTEGAFKEINTCPYCKCRMNMVERTVDAKGKIRYGGDTIGANRSMKIDTLPRMRWFSDAGELNEVEQERARDLWTLSDAKELAGLYDEVGVADHEVWNSIAETIGRSLYAVERQLRMIIHCPDELADYYPYQ